MVLIREDEQLCRNTLHASDIEGRHALSGIDAIILLTMDAEDRGIPLFNHLMWRIMVCLLGVGQLRTMPVCLVVLPIGEPVLFCLSIHGCQIESTIVGDESLEALFVDTSQIVNAETSERGTNSTQMILVYIGQILCCIVDSSQIVFDALACPVA